MIHITKLPERIKLIASLINKKSIVADIGCDHAYLLILLAAQNKLIKGYGIDNKKGPIQNAIKNISEFNFNNIIELKLSDGIKELNNDVNVLVLAGMGGLNIIDILSKNLNALNHIDEIILDAHNSRMEVRKYLINLGYKIETQLILFEKNIYYQIDKFIKAKAKENIDEIELNLGHLLLKNKNETYINYLKYLSNNLEFKILHNKNDEEINLAKKTLERINKYLYEH